MPIVILSVWILFVASYVMVRIFFPQTGSQVRKIKDIKGARVYDEDGYDQNGFTALGYHRNGTHFDDEGYDRNGLDANGNRRPEAKEAIYQSPDLDERTVSHATRTKILAIVMVAMTLVLVGVTVFDQVQQNSCVNGHKFVKTFCESPEKCTRCGYEKDEPLGHTWMDAACEHPKTCSFCRKKEGKPLGHTTDKGVCERCKKDMK